MVCVQHCKATWMLYGVCILLCQLTHIICSVNEALFRHLEKHSQPVTVVNHFPQPYAFFTTFAMPRVPVVMRQAIADYEVISRWTTDSHFLQLPTDGGRETRVYADIVRQHEANLHRVDESYQFRHVVNAYKNNRFVLTTMPKILLQELEIPRPFRCKNFNETFMDFLLWMSSKETVTNFIESTSDVLECVIDGQKDIILLNTSHLSFEQKVDAAAQLHNLTTVDDENIGDIVGKQRTWQARIGTGDCIFIPLNWLYQTSVKDMRTLTVMFWTFRETYSEYLFDFEHLCSHDTSKWTAANYSTRGAARHTFQCIIKRRLYNYGPLLLQQFHELFMGDMDTFNNKYTPWLKRAISEAFAEIDTNKDGIVELTDVVDFTYKEWLNVQEHLMSASHLYHIARKTSEGENVEDGHDEL